MTVLQMQPLIEYRLTVGDHETRALELEGTGPALILLHGYADSADTWRPLLDLLARQERRAIAVDLPGFGAASRLRSGLVMPQWEAFGAALVHQLHVEYGVPVVVGGNSLGGAISLRLAQRDDLPLAGVIPIAPAGLDHPRWFRLIERDPVVRGIFALPVPIPRPVLALSLAEVYRRLAFADGRAADRRVLRTFASHHPDRAAVARLLDTGRRLLPEISTPDTFDFTRTRVPVLLIWGTRDRMVSHSGAERVAAALPETEVRLLEGIGHCPQLEAPDRVAELLLDFTGSAVQEAA
jgi:pimeloyl-ACP methyl ester carboxylesterase